MNESNEQIANLVADLRQRVVDDMTVIENLLRDPGAINLPQNSTKPDTVQTAYREGGFSTDTTEYGGRSFYDVDITLDSMLEGDRFDRQVAKAAFRRFAFDLQRFPELAPEAASERALVIEARENAMGPVYLGSMPSHAFPYKLDLPREQRDPFQGKYFDFVDGHAWVFIRPTDSPAAFCHRYTVQLRESAARLRAEAREAEGGTVRPV